MKPLGKPVCDREKWKALQYKWALQADLSVFYANDGSILVTQNE